MFKTLVYNPDVRILIAHNGTEYDVSSDVVRGTIVRRSNSVSTLVFTLANSGLRYTGGPNGVRFSRMDRVSIWMKRIKWIQVFSGYLDSVPHTQLYPSTVEFRASCTLKRLLYTYWNPGLPESLELMQQFVHMDAYKEAVSGADPDDFGLPPPSIHDVLDDMGAYDGVRDNPGRDEREREREEARKKAQSEYGDSGIGGLLHALLTEVGGWDPEQVHIAKIPTEMAEFAEDAVAALGPEVDRELLELKKLFGYDETMPGFGSSGGNLGEATFTTIGPPANGSEYSDDELVWIAKHGGWTGDDIWTGAAVMRAESGGNPGAINSNNSDGSIDRGLWQINSIHDGRMPGQNRFDPAVSTMLAREIYQEAGGWGPWHALTVHHAAQQHFPRMQAAALRGGTPPPNSQTSGGGGTSLNLKDRVTGNLQKKDGGSGGGRILPGSVEDVQDNIRGFKREPYGLPVGTSIYYGAPGFPDWVYGMAAEFNLQASTYPGHQERDGYNKGIDWSGSVPDMQRFAEYLFSIRDQLEQVIWMNPHTNQKIGVADGKIVGPDHPETTNPTYYSNDWGGHQDHVHTRQSFSFGGEGIGLGGQFGSGSGSGGFANRLAKNLFTFMFQPGSFASPMATMFYGQKSYIVDQPLIQAVQSIVAAGLRDFCSAPNGDFVAWYPDYFGIGGSDAKIELEDIEMQDVRIDLSDDPLATHVFVAGDHTMTGGGDTVGNWIMSAGIASVEQEWLFKRVLEFSPGMEPDIDAEELMRHFGVRPMTQTFPNIGSPIMEMMVAIQLFMRKWSEQYETQVQFTFMPELFPGMRINLVGHGIQVYVSEVVHNFDFEAGFTTSAVIGSPSNPAGLDGRNASNSATINRRESDLHGHLDRSSGPPGDM